MQRRRRTLSACAVGLCVAFTAASCSDVTDTTTVAADKVPSNTALPTTTMVIGSLPTTTTTVRPPVSVPSAAASDTTGTLAALVGQLAANPNLIPELPTLDAAGIAELLGIDLDAIAQLGLTISQIASIGQSVLAAPPVVQADLTSGTVDPTVLLGLLAGSVDVNALAQGAIAQVVQGLVESIGGQAVTISDQLASQLAAVLGNLDPEGAGQTAADPQNAQLMALLTSAFLSVNPLLTEQLLANPALDPQLHDLLVQLAAVGASLDDAAVAALILAVGQLFPGAVPA